MSDSATDKNIKLAILDLVPVPEGYTPADAFRNSLDLAQQAERLGYNRYWLAEHHNMDGIASSATSILISHIASGTSRIRVGSGGIMLPNHPPLVVAESFGTLESLFPGRIDLGLGRAPGTDQLTAMALRHTPGEDFASGLRELMGYFSVDNAVSPVRAIPGEGLDIPIWLLGSSTYSAHLAAISGLPFAFASHFAPNLLHTALEVYRDNFRSSAHMARPYLMAGVNIIAADSDQEAERIATSLYMAFMNVLRGTRRKLQSPVDSTAMNWTEAERYAVKQMLQYTFVGAAETIKPQLQAFVDKTGVDELIIAGMIYDHQDRVRSYEIVSQLELRRSSVY